MTTVHPDPGVVWFQNIGFRPAVWTPPHRADGVDPDRLVPAPDADVAFISKYDAPAGYAWGTWIPAPTLTAADLAVPVTSTPFTAGPLIPPQPDPWFPCCGIREPAEPMPPVAPVPVPAAAPLLVLAIAALMMWRRK